MTERLRVREIDDDEGRRLVRIIRRGSGSVVTWRRAQMVLLSAQCMDAAAIAKVAFTSEDRVRDVIRNFNADGFSSLYPKYKGGRPPKFTLAQRREVKKIAKSKPVEHDLPFSTWSLAKLADFLVAEGVVDDISHEGLRVLLRQEGVTFQRLKTWKASKDPRYAEKKARIEQLHAIADRETAPGDGDPEIVFCVDEFGPLNLQLRPGRQWAAVSGKNKEPGREPRPRMRATYTRTAGVRHLFAAYELGEDRLFGHVKPRKTRTRFLEFCRSSIDVRLGGIYALQRLMQDSPRDQPTTVAVLCAFVRDSTRQNPAKPVNPPDAPKTDVQAALTVIGNRDPDKDDSSTVVDLSKTDLCR